MSILISKHIGCDPIRSSQSSEQTNQESPEPFAERMKPTNVIRSSSFVQHAGGTVQVTRRLTDIASMETDTKQIRQLTKTTAYFNTQTVQKEKNMITPTTSIKTQFVTASYHVQTSSKLIASTNLTIMNDTYRLNANKSSKPVEKNRNFSQQLKLKQQMMIQSKQMVNPINNVANNCSLSGCYCWTSSTYKLIVACSSFCGGTGKPSFEVHGKTIENKADCFEDIPKWIPGNTEVMYIKYANLMNLKKNSLESLSNLKILDLESNKINKIDDGAFVLMKELTELYFKNNYLTTISSTTFIGLVNLHRLDIYNNHINSLSDNAFSSSSLLKELRLSKNLITFISKLSYLIANCFLFSNYCCVAINFAIGLHLRHKIF